jgi:Arc/MetJ-type ribon-helix-helix transcriptional regulator
MPEILIYTNVYLIVMASDVVHIRIGEKLIKAIDDVVKETTYSSRTEFIREAVRKQVEEENRREALAMLRANFGKGRGKVKELTEERRAEIYEEFLKQKKH